MDNLNISFAPDKSAEDKGRINAVEDYLSLLTERIKFCLNGIDENIAQKSDGEEEKQLIYSTIADEVGQFTNTDKNCEVFNDYENNVASAYYSHAEGYKTTANAPYSHAEGSNTVASDLSCHAEGSGTTASGNCSHAENTGCIASGSNSHAEGYHTIARGEYSHASGAHTIAGMEVFALGRYNKKAEDVALVVGNGWGSGSNEWRSDALTLDYSGNLKLAGNLTANSPGWDYLGAEIHGAARFGNNWTSDSTSILLAVGNGADSKNLRDALTLDSDGNLHISGKFTADGGVSYVLSSATADTLGGVMIGDNINVSDSGTISVNLSAWIKVRSDVGLDASGYVMARFRSADDKKLYALSLTVGVDTVKDKWLYYKKTWTINDSDIAKLECVALALDKNGMIEACNIMLEKGTKATDWSPAAEEDTERIASLEARVAALEAMAVSGGEV